ncbi:metallophosphoesterase family protein [Thomasclavelia sp.]|uniref:metallophosphoesterase family protein n=1 Tax=Thomasclavelia sp. TaxID=3025757 RepID=UPI0025F41884|nr:metallophosphoesterase family protein [Thomasclavelia sp.]
MNDVFKKLVDVIFTKIPFSKKAEAVKYDVQKTLENLYVQENKETEINGLKNILAKVNDIYDAGKLAGYSETEIDELKDMSDLKDKKATQKVMKKYRRMILLESLIIMFMVNLMINIAYNLFFNCLYILILGIILFFVAKKRKNYLTEYNLLEIKCDDSGKKYIQSMNDKYIKKEINVTALCIILLAYLIFTNSYSYLTSAYTINDIYQQISYASTIIGLAVFLEFKNIGNRKLFGQYFNQDKEHEFQAQIKKISIFCFIYWALIITLLLLFKNSATYSLNYFLIAAIINLVILFIYNLTLRKQLVIQNIVVNVKRIALVSLSVILIVGYQFMSMDFWLIQPYINTVSPIEREADEISYNDENGVYTITTEKSDFKIMQLTDIHLGGSVFSLSKDLKALQAIEKLVNVANPDFIVVTGDLVFPMGIMSYSLNNRAPIVQFAAFMRNLGIPWAFTYGNHDTEAMSVITDEQFDELLKSLSYRTSKNLLYPYIQSDIYGRSNQLIEIRNSDGTLMQALFLLDSNDYIPGGSLNEYDYIHDDQVDWYQKQVERLSKQEGYTIPSMLFFHIPLQEYREAYELYEDNSDEVTYYYGEIGETMIDKICASKYPSKLFDTAVKLNSTKAMFCGHDHYNNLSVEYQGIRLTYGYSIDYLAMPGIEDDTKQRGATLITIAKDGTFTIDPYRLIDIR